MAIGPISPTHQTHAKDPENYAQNMSNIISKLTSFVRDESPSEYLKEYGSLTAGIFQNAYDDPHNPGSLEIYNSVSNMENEIASYCNGDPKVTKDTVLSDLDRLDNLVKGTPIPEKDYDFSLTCFADPNIYCEQLYNEIHAKDVNFSYVRQTASDILITMNIFLELPEGKEVNDQNDNCIGRICDLARDTLLESSKQDPSLSTLKAYVDSSYPNPGIALLGQAIDAAVTKCPWWGNFK